MSSLNIAKAIRAHLWKLCFQPWHLNSLMQCDRLGFEAFCFNTTMNNEHSWMNSAHYTMFSNWRNIYLKPRAERGGRGPRKSGDLHLLCACSALALVPKITWNCQTNTRNSKSCNKSRQAPNISETSQKLSEIPETTKSYQELPKGTNTMRNSKTFQTLPAAITTF